MIAALAIVLIIVYLVVNLSLVWMRNRETHRFFEKRMPDLPVVPNPTIFGGHLQQIIEPWKNWRIISELHQKYGPTFGYFIGGAPWVSTTDLDLIKLINLDEAQKHLDRPNFGVPFPKMNDSFFQINGDKWRQVRRIIGPTMTNHKIRSEEVSSDIESVVAQLAASMQRRARKSRDAHPDGKCSFVVDARDLFERYALAVIFLLTYKQVNLIDFDGEQDQWVEALASGGRDLPNPVVSASMMFPFLRPLCNFLVQFSTIGRAELKIFDYIEKAVDVNRKAREQHTREQQLAETLKRPGDPTREPPKSFAEINSKGEFKRRLVDTIIDSFLDKKIHYDNFVGSLLFLLLAGFMTTADTIACLLWQLARNPDVQEKLRKSLREEGIDADYVVWCINETVRFHPAVPRAVGRVLGEDIKVNGQFLAKGTFVMTSAHTIHHDPRIWPAPERFHPERWRNQASFHPAAFVGFGLGPRNCLGGKLAVHETKLVMRMILASYRIGICDRTPKEWHFSSPGMFFTINDEPIYLEFTPLNETEPDAAA